MNANVLVNWQRAIKSSAEIENMHRAAKIVEDMHATILERTEPGMKKNELIADIYHAAITGADGHWGDYPSIVPPAPPDEDATAPHLTWNDDVLLKDGAPFFEIASVYRRYHAPQSRTLFFTAPPAKYRAAVTTNLTEIGHDFQLHAHLMVR